MLGQVLKRWKQTFNYEPSSNPILKPEPKWSLNSWLRVGCHSVTIIIEMHVVDSMSYLNELLHESIGTTKAKAILITMVVRFSAQIRWLKYSQSNFHSWSSQLMKLIAPSVRTSIFWHSHWWVVFALRDSDLSSVINAILVNGCGQQDEADSFELRNWFWA